MKRLRLIFPLSLALLLSVVPATFSSAQDIGVGVRVGTTGVGGSIAYGITRKLSLRANGSVFSYGVEDTVGEDPRLRATGDANVGAFSGFLDFHPFGNSFRLTGGVGKNNFQVDAVAIPLDPVCFGNEDNAGVCDGKVFSPERLGTLKATVKYPAALHPYVGLGFGNLATGNSRVTFLLDLGAYYSSAPELSLENDGLFGPTADPENVQTINDGIKSFAWYPVISIGVGFRL